MSPRRLLPPLIALVLVLAACQPSASVSEPLRAVKLLLGFRPDVQFAPFYLAQQAGYFADAGLEVTIEHSNDALVLVADGRAEFGVADATDVMIARTSGIPVKYISTLYDHFPVAVIGPAGTVPSDPVELAGKRIGTPGEFGSSWHALRALLDAGGLAVDDVTIRDYPQFNQVEGLLNGDVVLITGFRNNEPLRLEAQGMSVDLLTVDEIAPLPGPGLIVGDELLASDPELTTAFAAATLRAQQAIAADPQVGLDAAVVAVPAISEDLDTTLAVLEATVELWSQDGTINTAVWISGYETMRRLGFIDGSASLDDMTSDVLLTPPPPIAESVRPSVVATLEGQTPGPGAAAPAGGMYVPDLTIEEVVEAAWGEGFSCESLYGNVSGDETAYELICTMDDQSAGYSFYVEAHYWAPDRVAQVHVGAQPLGDNRDLAESRRLLGSLLTVPFDESQREAALAWFSTHFDDMACSPCVETFSGIEVELQASARLGSGSFTIHGTAVASGRLSVSAQFGSGTELRLGRA